MNDNSRSDQYSERIIDLLSKIADEDPKDKQSQNDAKRRAKKHLKALTDNGLALVGLSRGMLSLSKVVGDQLAMNSRLAEGLGQTADALKGVVSVTERFITGQQTFEQKIKVFTDAVNLGMTTFSNETLQFGSQLKVMGIQNKTAFQLIRANTQGLGLSEEASLRLTQQLVTTAAENKDSISGLINAINGMKDAMVSTAVELGPKTALNAQKIVAMMTQNNSELQDASEKFVKSFLAGSDGYMKAARLGVRFEEGESLSSMARKFETILGKVHGLQAGKRGAGSQFFFDAMEQGFALSRNDFNLQRQIGIHIKELKENNVEQLSRASARMNLQQQLGEALDGIQSELSRLTAAAALGFDKLRTTFETHWTSLKNWFDDNLKEPMTFFKNFWANSSGLTKALIGVGAFIAITNPFMLLTTALSVGGSLFGLVAAVTGISAPIVAAIGALAFVTYGLSKGWKDFKEGRWIAGAFEVKAWWHNLIGQTGKAKTAQDLAEFSRTDPSMQPGMVSRAVGMTLENAVRSLNPIKQAQHTWGVVRDLVSPSDADSSKQNAQENWGSDSFIPASQVIAATRTEEQRKEGAAILRIAEATEKTAEGTAAAAESREEFIRRTGQAWGWSSRQSW